MRNGETQSTTEPHILHIIYNIIKSDALGLREKEKCNQITPFTFYKSTLVIYIDTISF